MRSSKKFRRAITFFFKNRGLEIAFWPTTWTRWRKEHYFWEATATQPRADFYEYGVGPFVVTYQREKSEKLIRNFKYGVLIVGAHTSRGWDDKEGFWSDRA